MWSLEKTREIAETEGAAEAVRYVVEETGDSWESAVELVETILKMVRDDD